MAHKKSGYYKLGYIQNRGNDTEFKGTDKARKVQYSSNITLHVGPDWLHNVLS